MLIAISQRDDERSDVIVERLLFDLPDSLGAEVLAFLDTGICDGALWDALVETLVMLEALGSLRTGTSDSGKAVHELSPEKRAVLTARCIREQYDEYEMGSGLLNTSPQVCQLELQWSHTDSFDVSS